MTDQPAPARNEVPIALFNVADTGYFRSMRIPLRQGREFNAADTASGLKVAIVNETLARRWWPVGTAIIVHGRAGALQYSGHEGKTFAPVAG